MSINIKTAKKTKRDFWVYCTGHYSCTYLENGSRSTMRGLNRWCCVICDCSLTEDRFGKVGRVRTWEPLGPHLPGQATWLELETLYRLDEHTYDLKSNFNVSLEDWTNFGGAVDRMFVLLGNFNHLDRRQHVPRGGEGGDRAVVSSTSQSTSAVYLTTLATPAFLLRKAGAEALQDALGLSREMGDSSSSSSSSPSLALPSQRATNPLLFHELQADDQANPDEEDEEEDDFRRSRLMNHTPCNCSEFIREDTHGTASWTAVSRALEPAPPASPEYWLYPLRQRTCTLYDKQSFPVKIPFNISHKRSIHCSSK